MEHAVDPETSAAVTGFAREWGVTVGAVVQAAWAVLLGALVGRADVVFGVTVSGRPAELDGAESMVGLFINTVPQRVRVDPAEALGDLVVRVQAERSVLLAHEHVGLAEIQRIAGHGELFDTAMVVENYPAGDEVTEVVPGLEVVGTDGYDSTHFRSRSRCSPTTSCGCGSTAPRPVRRPGPGRDRGAVHRHPAHYQRRTGAARGPRRAAHRRGGPLADGSGSRGRAAEPGALWHNLVERRAAHAPARPAVEFGAGTLTAAELNDRANRLARLLIARGAGPERFIAMALPRSLELPVVMLAVAKTGAALVPFDLAHPAERIQLVLGDTDPVLVVTTLDAGFAEGGVPRIVLDDPATVADLAALAADDVRDGAHRPLHASHPPTPCTPPGRPAAPRPSSSPTRAARTRRGPDRAVRGGRGQQGAAVRVTHLRRLGLRADDRAALRRDGGVRLLRPAAAGSWAGRPARGQGDHPRHPATGRARRAAGRRRSGGHRDHCGR
ncbi:condensation domain-containing protein [Streptomyces sp. M10(2022)]